MMLFVCLNLTREHWQNFFNYESEKENFYTPESSDSFEFKVDQFADLAILR